MNVLIAADGWHDEAPGGGNKVPTDLARYLAARGCHVTYACASRQVAALSTTRVDGVDLRRYPTPRAASPNPLNALAHIRATFRIARDLRRHRGVAVLLGHNQLQYLGAAIGCGAAARRCYTVHSPFVDEQREGAIGPPTLAHTLAWRGAAAIERRILALSDAVHYLSEYTRSVIETEYPGLVGAKGIVLPGWVDAQRFRPAREPRRDLRARLGSPWTANVPTFFTLRRLEPRMGLDTLIDAAALLSRESRPFRVVIAGDGRERAGLEARAAAAGLTDRVVFAGRIGDDALADWYAAADWFVLPTRALECFGLIVLESYAAGVPVIGAPVGAIPETMGAENAGWLAVDAGAAAIAARMREALDGTLAADPARLRARAERFDLRVVAPLYERHLLGLAAAAASGAAVA